jgi:uncharacterized protein (DUF58 family)
LIYPTQRAAMLVALAAPAGLAVGALVPGGWMLVIGWVALVLMLVLIDGFRAPSLAGPVDIDAPLMAPVGAPVAIGGRFGAHDDAETALDVGDPLAIEPSGVWRAKRRGAARIVRIWARRRGALGLAWRQRSEPVDHAIRIAPDLGPVREQGMKQYLRSTQFGARLRTDSGDGQEFQALTDFQPGMPRRAIDWKASARHLGLVAREFRTERDHSVVLAVDAGRAMVDPLDGVPRIDRAVSAALLTAFVALKSGDRVRLFGFDARPRVDTGTLAGTRAFARLHAQAADIDYAAGESNYTLSLTTLDQRLDRRSLIVLFTEFSDPTAAELLLAAGQRLLRRHRLLFVLFQDAELEGFATRRPESADDVTRANVAETLLRDRRITIERLRRQGIDVIEAEASAAPLALVERYLALRERVA